MDSFITSLQTLFDNNVIILVLQGIGLYIAILWIAIIIWVSKDANNRSTNILFQVLSILIVIALTPLFGLLIYLIIRPSKTLTEKYLEDVQMELLSDEELKVSNERCTHCNGIVQSDHIYCPHCATKLQKTCISCKKKYNLSWNICPYCGKKEPLRKQKKEEALTSIPPKEV